MRVQTRRLLAVALLMIWPLVLPLARAGTLLSTKREQAGDSYIAYPQLEGMDNTFIQDTVNNAVKASLGEHFNTLKVLASSVSGQLNVDGEALIIPSADGHDVLSVLMMASGRMPGGRNGYSYIPLQFDLADGQAVGAEQIFLDKENAEAWILEDLHHRLEDHLSNYLDIGGLEPFPIDRALLSGSGITFYYPDNTMAWLSGKPAAIRYLYHELKDILNLETGSLLYNLGVPGKLATNAGTAKQVRVLAEQGRLPGLPVRLGDSLEKLIGVYGLQYDAEGFPGGEKYQLEDDAFRGTSLIYSDGATLHGLLSTRMNLEGLITGESSGENVLETLGQPMISLPLTQDAAAVYGLPEGRLDNYLHGENELKLYYDTGNTLFAVWLQNTNQGKAGE